MHHRKFEVISRRRYIVHENCCSALFCYHISLFCTFWIIIGKLCLRHTRTEFQIFRLSYWKISFTSWLASTRKHMHNQTRLCNVTYHVRQLIWHVPESRSSERGREKTFSSISFRWSLLTLGYPPPARPERAFIWDVRTVSCSRTVTPDNSVRGEGVPPPPAFPEPRDKVSHNVTDFVKPYQTSHPPKAWEQRPSIFSGKWGRHIRSTDATPKNVCDCTVTYSFCRINMEVSVHTLHRFSLKKTTGVQIKIT